MFWMVFWGSVCSYLSVDIYVQSGCLTMFSDSCWFLTCSIPDGGSVLKQQTISTISRPMGLGPNSIKLGEKGRKQSSTHPAKTQGNFIHFCFCLFYSLSCFGFVFGRFWQCFVLLIDFACCFLTKTVWVIMFYGGVNCFRSVWPSVRPSVQPCPHTSVLLTLCLYKVHCWCFIINYLHIP